MATNVGRAEIDVVANGRGLNQNIRQIARKSGHDFGEQFAKSYETSGAPRAFQSIMKSFDKVRANATSFHHPLKRLNEQWKNLSHNTRQWGLIVGAVAAGMQNLAVLGSAAGGGLFVLGGAATGALVGIGALVVAFKGLGGDLEKLPESVRPAAQAFQDLKGPLQEVQDALQERAFAGADAAFTSIGASIRKLIPAFGPLGDAINNIVKSFAAWLESEKGIRLMTSLISKSGPIFEKVLRIVGKFGEALLVAFDNPRFQKALDDMLTGLDGMVNTFSKFVESDEFGTWMDNTSFIMGKLGDLIGATSKLFSDLVTPEAIERTGTFLDNLTRFMPHLTSLLDILGRLDIFGLVAQALADIGDALEPLAKPFGELADGLREIVEIAIDEWGKNLKGVADDLAPLVQGLADMVKDVDPKVVRAIADALFVVAGAMVALKAARILGTALGLGSFFAELKKGTPILKAFPLSKLGAIARGIGGIGLIASAELIPQSFWDQFDIESNFPKNALTGAGLGLLFFGPIGAAIGAGLGLVYSLFTEFESTMNDVGTNLLGMFTTGPFGLLGASVATFFANLVPEEWATSDNPFEKAFAAAAFVVTNFGTTLLLMGEVIGTWFTDVTTGFNNWRFTVITTWQETWAVLSNPAFWEIIGVLISVWLQGLQAKFDQWWSTVTTGWTTFWEGLATSLSTTWNRIVSIVTVWLAVLSTNISAGLAGAANAWNNFWGSIPNAVSDAVSRVTGLVDGLISAVNRALGSIGSLNRASGSAFGRGGGAEQAFASGGVLNGPRRILAGEAGPEAIVPLRRPLNRVDPSVRWLSAMAQGKTPAMASGGVVGGGRTNNVEAGAIVVQGAVSPLATGVEILNRLTENLI